MTCVSKEPSGLHWRSVHPRQVAISTGPLGRLRPKVKPMTTVHIRRPVVLLAVVGLSLLIPERAAAQPEESVVIGKKVEMFSEILDENRPLIIGTPRRYETSEEHYPVVYLLDGDVHFHHTTGTADYLAVHGRMPEVITVAIPNTDRSRDLTPPSAQEWDREHFPTHGGADAFLRFISDELMPWVDRQYRTRPHATLVGHSFGGLFAIHALLARPDVFDAYIAISPSLQWDDQRLALQAASVFENTPELTADLYMTVGNEGRALLGGVRKLAGVLDEHAPKGFRWAFRLMEEESHGSVPLRSTRQGLEAVFDGWNLHDVLETYESGGLAAIDDHYSRGGARFGYDRSTPTSAVLTLIFQLIGHERLEEAATVLLRDPETHAPAPTALAALADAYADRDDRARALEYYTMSLQANPGSDRVRRKLLDMGVDVAALIESPQTRVGGNGRRSMAREPQNTPCSRPLLRPRDYARQAHAPTVPRASGVKTSTAWTPPSRRGRKAHNCSLSGRTAGVSPARAEAPAEDAPSALTRRSARSYLAPTPQPATARPSAAAADPPRF